MNKSYLKWVITLVIEMIIMVTTLSFLPWKLIITFNDVKYVSIILLIPFCMLMFTPIWIKLKKLKSNHFVLKINSFLLMISLTMLFLSFTFIDSSFSLSLSLTIIFTIMSGIFFAGIVPITIEIIKSYSIDNSFKSKHGFYMSLFSWVLIWLPYVLDFYSGFKYANLILILILSLVCFIFVITNKNIMTKPNVLHFEKSDISALKRNKKFFSMIFINNYFVGIAKFFELIIPLLLLLNLSYQKVEFIILSDWQTLLFILFAFFAKYIAQFIFKNIRTEFYFIEINIGMAIFAFGLFLLITPLIFAMLVEFTNSIIIYKIIIVLSQFFIAGGYALIEKNKYKIYKKTLYSNIQQLGMIVDHVLGNGFYSLILCVIFLTITVFTSVTLLSLLITFVLMFTIAIIFIILNLVFFRANANIGAKRWKL